VQEWVARFGGRVVHVAVEACTGWLFVCRALERRGAIVHLAEPVGTSALRGRKRRAKTDRTDAKWLRELLFQGRLPEACIPPEQAGRHGLRVMHPGLSASQATDRRVVR
jgi:transposase